MLKIAKSWCCTALAISLLSGCASMSETAKPTEEGLRKRTANVLGYSPEQIRISNIRSDGSDTYWLADTPKGRYTCSAPSGTWMAIVSMGQTLSNMKTCEKQ